MSELLPEVAERWLVGQGAASLSLPVQRLSEAYRMGKSSSDPGVDLRAYVVSRLPATFAATGRVLKELASLRPDWKPRSLIDLGAGPGTASWAAATIWPGISQFDQVEREASFRQLARALLKECPLAALARATVHDANVLEYEAETRADLVIAAYALIELAAHQVQKAVERAWRMTGSSLVIVEPGTPHAFERLRGIRNHLISLGANVLAPCSGNGNCPMQPPDWCHFAQRLSRSRLHMHAKSAEVPFEDEKFCYLVAVKEPAQSAPARILKPVRRMKHAVELSICGQNGLQQQMVAKRDKPAYKIASRLQWGDTVPLASTSGEGNGT